MSKFSDHPTTSTNFRLTLGPVARPVDTIRYLSVHDFERLFGCRINSLPRNVCLLGWIKQTRRWYCAPETHGLRQSDHNSSVFHHRVVEKLLPFLAADAVPHLDQQSLWLPLCFYDGWRERNVYSANYRWVMPPDLTAHPEWRGAPGEIPMLSPDRAWLACFGAHRGDPSALLWPDAYYRSQNCYVSLFAEIARLQIPWGQRKRRAILAASDHGESSNLFAPTAEPDLHPRRLFKQTVENQGLDVDVYLGQRVSHADQLDYRFIADVDGYVRTWDAWAWKMVSGSVVLSVSSPWTSFFSEQFSPWEHYVPVANDCSDLAEKLAWCRDHDAECEVIAQRARIRALDVYKRSVVANRVITQLRDQLTAPIPAGFSSIESRADGSSCNA